MEKIRARKASREHKRAQARRAQARRCSARPSQPSGACSLAAARQPAAFFPSSRASRTARKPHCARTALRANRTARELRRDAARAHQHMSASTPRAWEALRRLAQRLSHADWLARHAA